LTALELAALTRLGIPAVLYIVDHIQRGPYSREFTADVIDLAFGYFADRTTTVDIRHSTLSSVQGLTQPRGWTYRELADDVDGIVCVGITLASPR
jgi:hypothetical protein